MVKHFRPRCGVLIDEVTFLGNFNIDQCTSYDMSRAHMLTYETLIDDESNQILGFTHVGDAAGGMALN